ncbi:MAG: protein phosphatase 2C domain-containing protein [Taibaiella sp.]|nr:protein phosphatase 2C domain-containing protein [Taibaiella sp.]
MSDAKVFIQTLFDNKNIKTDATKPSVFEEFVSDEANVLLVNEISRNEKMLLEKWRIKNRLGEIARQQVLIPNATVGKSYTAVMDLAQLGWADLSDYALTAVGEMPGLTVGADNLSVNGIPSVSGEIRFVFAFRIQGETMDSPLHEKAITLTINPDPKTLWKNKPGDREAKYWKEEDVAQSDGFGERNIVVVSKRGRSHANSGTFRDDDFAYKHFNNNGWSVVAVSDGAGSAHLSRKGSQLACAAVIDFVAGYFTVDVATSFDIVISTFKKEGGEENQKKLSQLIYDCLSKAAWAAHQQILNLSKETGDALKDFHSTLIFTLFKKYEFGYAFLSFGVGDCPIGLISKDLTEVTLMNWLDVGEYGGGTRFITMPEIFTSDKFATRFKFKLVEDFAYLMMMTDGVYDPKFVVEANLEKAENWRSFISDIEGNNDDGIKVEFKTGNADVAQQLSLWMDFWSAGNHDDRTLAIVF